MDRSPLETLESLTRPPGSRGRSILVLKNEFRVSIASATEILEMYYSSSDFSVSEKRSLSAEVIRIRTAIDVILKVMDEEKVEPERLQSAIKDLESSWTNFKLRAASILKTRESKPQFPQELAKAQTIIHDSLKMIKRFLKGPKSPRVKVTRDSPSPPRVEKRPTHSPEKEEVEMSKEETEQCLRKIDELKQEILASENRNKEAQKQLRALIKENSRRKSDIGGDIHEKYCSVLEQQKAELVAKTKEVSESIENLCLVIDETERDTDDKIAQFERDAAELRTEHERYCREVLGSKQLKSALDREYYDLNMQIRKVTEEKRQLRRRVHHAKQDLEQLQAEKDEINTIMRQWRQELSELKSQSASLEAEITAMKEKRNKGTDLDRAYAKWDDLEDDLYKLRQRYHELRKVIIPDLNFQISKCSSEIGHLAVTQQKGDPELTMLEMRMITQKLSEMFPM